MFSKARWRLTIWFAAVVIVILAVIGFAVYGSARRSLLDGVDSDLETRAAPLQDRAFRGARLRELAIGPAFTAGGYFYAAVGPEGTVLATSGNTDPDGLALTEDVSEAAEGGAKFVNTESSAGESLRVYLAPLRIGPQTIVLEVGRSMEPEQKALARLLVILGAGGAAGVVLAIAAGFALAGRALRPIEESVERQRTFVADASHELRTPLAVIRANAEVLKREAEHPVDANISSVDDIISETDRLSNIVSQMLKLARADSGEAPLEAAEVDVSDLANQAVRQMSVLAGPKGIELASEVNGVAHVRGNENLLRELLTILLDNSIKYSERGASVRVDVNPNGDRVRVSVADTGRGIPAAALPHIFDRFYRVDKARSREMGGAGLGLAIAKWIVEAHKGTIDIKSGAREGTTVTVDLPAAR